MGAANSSEPRSVSMDNPTGVIDVSDEVVERLKKGLSKQAKEKESAKKATPPPKPPKVETKKVERPPPPAPVQKIIYQAPPTVYMGPGGTTLTAADVMRQKENELKQNDAMWRQRMSELEQTLKKTNSIMESEYSAAVDDVRKRFATASAVHQLPPCQDLKAKLIACYRAHPGETLLCADEVAQFRNCVSMHRVKKLDAEEQQSAAAPATVPATKAAKGA